MRGQYPRPLDDGTFEWLGDEDSNLGQWDQNPPYCPYTIPQQNSECYIGFFLKSSQKNRNQRTKYASDKRALWIHFPASHPVVTVKTVKFDLLISAPFFYLGTSSLKFTARRRIHRAWHIPAKRGNRRRMAIYINFWNSRKERQGVGMKRLFKKLRCLLSHLRVAEGYLKLVKSSWLRRA